jgi:NADH-quinone oxidoreductase subunit L
MHHEQDMRYYGGLRKSIPLTFAAMTIGTLALTGFFYTSGYYSKDAIIEVAFARGTEAGFVAYFVGIFVALLTSFYSWRLVFLTFFGAPRWAGSQNIAHAGDHAHDEGTTDSATRPDTHVPQVETGTGGYHPHEAPPSMLVPLAVLAIGALFAGWLLHDGFMGHHGDSGFWARSIAFDRELMESIHDVPTWVVWSPAVAMLLGFLLALRYYVFRPEAAVDFVQNFRGLHHFLTKKWYFDELYDLIFVRPAFALGRLFWTRGDQRGIDRFGPDGISALVGGASVFAKRVQSGYVYTYAFVMLIGIAAAATFFMFRAG